ncbi:hypothetical protein AB0M29_12390 [Streptomyces sp. NPDC051976]|uniref:hypothetical protein n=1 Tax=Streptomyces sp. NPDC051976 TaxID=3154947 RepID=UPI003426E039
MRRRTFTGAGIAAVAVAATLALSGCSSDSGNDGKKDPTTSAAGVPTAAPTKVTAGTTAPVTPSGTSDGNPTGSVEGVWLAAQGANKVQLVLGKGQAGLTSTHLCGGTYTDHNGIDLKLTCMDGNKERTNGVGVLTADGKTLTVQWTGGLTDTFSRTGLPSS